MMVKYWMGVNFMECEWEMSEKIDVDEILVNEGVRGITCRCGSNNVRVQEKNEIVFLKCDDCGNEAVWKYL